MSDNSKIYIWRIFNSWQFRSKVFVIERNQSPEIIKAKSSEYRVCGLNTLVLIRISKVVKLQQTGYLTLTVVSVLCEVSNKGQHA